MKVKDFLAPTRGRILLFTIIFLLVFVYDTAFAPFPGSPVVGNLGSQEGALSFVVYILVLPYILSCLIPALLGMRKRRFMRLARLREFFYSRPVVHEKKPSRQQTFTFPTGTPVVESRLPVKPQGRAGRPGASRKATKPAKKTKGKSKK